MEFWRRLRRNRLSVVGGAWLIAIAAIAVLGPLVYGVSFEDVDILHRLAGPSWQHPLGTDETGRDVLARLMLGGQVSLLVSVVAAGVSLGVGVLVGLVAGYRGGKVGAVLMRLTDAFMSVPLFFFLLAVLALFGASLGTLVLGIGLTSWMGVARVVRGEVLRHRALEFVLAARALGAGDGRILFAHLLPQAVPAIIVAANLGAAHAILAETSLSYLGIGIQPPMPSWGNMLSGAQSNVWTAPVLAVYPGVLILLTVLGSNALGDGLRDALDPYFKDEQGA